ncbi:hypothetical protein DLM45_04565 [Hyphomicrobium methylovorum]|nr:hypothetical protein [Hyphomicrobium methylovorum]
MVALQQANVTGNYSVLRDLAAPSFRDINSAESLSAAFAGLRASGGDMAPIVLALPTLSRQPFVDQNGMLRVAGTFDVGTNVVVFDLAFQAISGIWKVNAIAVNFRAAQTAKPAPTQPPATKKTESKKTRTSTP